MNITEYCDAINAELDIKYYPNQDGRWCASFSDCELKDGGILIGTYGDGKSPEEAVKNYVERIAGNTVVFSATSNKYRREFTVPKTLLGEV